MLVLNVLHDLRRWKREVMKSRTVSVKWDSLAFMMRASLVIVESTRTTLAARPVLIATEASTEAHMAHTQNQLASSVQITQSPSPGAGTFRIARARQASVEMMGGPA